MFFKAVYLKKCIKNNSRTFSNLIFLFKKAINIFYSVLFSGLACYQRTKTLESRLRFRKTALPPPQWTKVSRTRPRSRPFRWKTDSFIFSRRPKRRLTSSCTTNRLTDRQKRKLFRLLYKINHTYLGNSSSRLCLLALDLNYSF